MDTDCMDTHFAELEQRLWDAIASRDFGAFERLLAPTFVSIDDGNVATADALVADLQDVRLNEFALEQLTVTKPAPSVAVVTYRVQEQLLLQSHLRERRTAATSIWLNGDGTWQLAIHHEATIRDVP